MSYIICKKFNFELIKYLELIYIRIKLKPLFTIVIKLKYNLNELDSIIVSINVLYSNYYAKQVHFSLYLNSKIKNKLQTYILKCFTFNKKYVINLKFV